MKGEEGGRGERISWGVSKESFFNLDRASPHSDSTSCKRRPLQIKERFGGGGGGAGPGTWGRCDQRDEYLCREDWERGGGVRNGELKNGELSKDSQE